MQASAIYPPCGAPVAFSGAVSGKAFVGDSVWCRTTACGVVRQVCMSFDRFVVWSCRSKKFKNNYNVIKRYLII